MFLKPECTIVVQLYTPWTPVYRCFKQRSRMLLLLHKYKYGLAIV